MKPAEGEKTKIRKPIPAPHMFLNSFERADNPNYGRSPIGAWRPILIPINSTHVCILLYFEVSLWAEIKGRLDPDINIKRSLYLRSEWVPSLGHSGERLCTTKRRRSFVLLAHRKKHYAMAVHITKHEKKTRQKKSIG